MRKAPDSSLMKALARAVKGLSYMSEADYPFTVVSLGAAPKSLTPPTFLKLVGVPPEIPVEATNFNSFFRTLTEEQEWHGPAERETVARYKELLKVFKDNLRDPKIFKLGEVEKDIYVIGTSSAGEIVGVKTKAVET